MINYETLQRQACDAGFTHSGALDVSTLQFLQEVRDMCSADKCNKYDKSWACPPACGTLGEMREKVAAYSKGLIVQTVGELEDSYDWDGIQDAAKKQGETFASLWKTLKKTYPNLLAMGAGGCAKCETCTYPDAPCRFPDEVAASMEACGLVVSRVCADNGVKYNYGPNTIAYTGCFLLE
jgi:predicted metal-binding protein